MHLSTDKAPGLDYIPANLIKIADPIIYFIIDDWKTAKVIPIHKQNDKNDSNNYRPIRIISVLSNVFETIVYDQLCDYLTTNGLLNKYQSSFRSMCSMVTALLDATTEWYLNSRPNEGVWYCKSQYIK